MPDPNTESGMSPKLKSRLKYIASFGVVLLISKFAILLFTGQVT